MVSDTFGNKPFHLKKGRRLHTTSKEKYASNTKTATPI
jgi:hypothetical protein